MRCIRCFRSHYASSEKCKQIRDQTYKKNDYIISILLANKLIKSKVEILDLKYATNSVVREIEKENENIQVDNNQLNKLKEELKQELKIMKNEISENKQRLDKHELINNQLIST